ncbi:Hypothetical protein ORPV_353 [Orpheovirus IHUMI-LCC2]|uniref:Uncharacterized protein n=1 Tax=Orpheovirus IHUMI-LCC2 TaxID=2023057 RepID=A0A2I2L412_9VIRU|nr:Hypothetical protein ORPV_353 [Orpheovirus IHUMI-LCC2]SNW62257.1 Hypothetical protein ORPV_353 [Orpheovirus IHUMI-LCC2]
MEVFESIIEEKLISTSKLRKDDIKNIVDIIIDCLIEDIRDYIEIRKKITITKCTDNKIYYDIIIFILKLVWNNLGCTIQDIHHSLVKVRSEFEEEISKIMMILHRNNKLETEQIKTLQNIKDWNKNRIKIIPIKNNINYRSIRFENEDDENIDWDIKHGIEEIMNYLSLDKELVIELDRISNNDYKFTGCSLVLRVSCNGYGHPHLTFFTKMIDYNVSRCSIM